MNDRVYEIRVGRTAAQAVEEFSAAWQRAAQGEDVQHYVLGFADWETLFAVLTPARVRLLRHLASHPEPSIRALAGALERNYRNVHEDVKALEAAGFIARTDEGLRAIATKFRADIDLLAA